MTRFVRALVLMLAVTMPVAAVDYVRLSPSEFAEDLARAGRFVEAGRFADALTVLKVLVADEPDDADALSLMGYTLRHLGDYEAARAVYSKALAIAPDHAGAIQYLGELHAELGELDLARAQLLHLDQVCGTDCAGRDELAAAIEAAR